MALDRCDACCNVDMWARTTDTFRSANLQILCDILATLQGSSPDIGELVQVTNGAGAAAVNIQDGGNSITVDGTVAVTNAWANANLTSSYTAVTTSGTIAINAYAISIANVGTAAGTVKTVAFPAGAVIEFEAFVDPTSQTVKKLPAIAYDATGTTFNISVLT